MRCPKAGSVLEKVTVSTVSLDKCHHCDGLWLDEGEIKIIRNLDLDEVEESLEREFGNPEVDIAPEKESFMRCPRCEDGRMHRHHISYYVPVRVDQCMECHGIWLDDGELDALLLDRTKMNEELNCKRLFLLARKLMQKLL